MKKENTSIKKVPNLRFPEFIDEWETKKLGEIATFYSGGTPLTSKREYFNGNIPFIRSGEINSQQTEQFISELGLKNSSAKMVEIGDILYALYGATSGEVGISKIKGAINQAVLCIKSTENHYFLYSYLSHRKEIITRTYLQGGQGNLSSEIVKQIVLSFPIIKEQNKISSFLSLIDTRIHTQSKIIDNLKVSKSAIAKKIFSQQLRFKDENGNYFSDWEEIKLLEILSIPDKIKPAFIDKNKLITVKLHLKGVLKNENTETLSLGATNYFIRKKGQFIYGKQNLFNGAFGIVPNELDGFLSSGDVPSLDVNYSKINTLFLLNFLGRENFYKRLEGVATGSGSKRIHEETFLNVKIEIPCIQEQQKIANFLSSIDNKIEIETNVLQKLEEQKKFLLQNMFV